MAVNDVLSQLQKRKFVDDDFFVFILNNKNKEATIEYVYVVAWKVYCPEQRTILKADIEQFSHLFRTLICHCGSSLIG